MRVLLYIGSHDNNSINAAYEHLEKGDDVTILSCDSSLGICRDNYFGNKLFCRLCMRANREVWKEDLLEKGANILYLKNLITKSDENDARNFQFDYDDIKSLKNIKYKNVEIGFAAFSTYVSVTRNVMPEITKEFKRYENFLMKKEILSINVIERLIEEIRPDVMVFHNGRFAEFKPMLGLAHNNRINFVTTEEVYFEGKILKNYFVNSGVHSIEAKFKEYINNWEIGKESEAEKIAIAKSFFENRIKKIPTGDKVYTKDQKEGLLPDGFEKDKEIITIFNSSEDEFCAISSEYDTYSLFENQYIGLKTILEHYKDDCSKHFYLRVHPNLRNVPYRSHKDLYKLKSENFTIIPPDSPVDSYVLMENSDKIVIFNSTIGMESSYWGKPVIELSKYTWSLMDITYTPSTLDELWNLIDTPDLPCKYNDNCLKYAYWVLHPNYEEEKYIKCENVDINFLGVKIHQEHQFLKIFGSVKLNSILRILFTRKFVMKILRPFCHFTSLPCTVNM